MGLLLKRLFVSLLAIFTAFILTTIILVVVISLMLQGLLPSASEEIARGTVLEINLNEEIVDAPNLSPVAELRAMLLGDSPEVSLLGLLRALEAAEADPNITALSLRMDGGEALPLELASEIRGALQEFRERCSKPIYAYSEGYSQVGYYLASMADSLYLNPMGAVEWQGVATSTLFYGDLLKDIGVDVEVFRPEACSYKSAVEPYISSGMSRQSREQSQGLVDGFWRGIVGEVAYSRSLDTALLRRVAREQIIIEADSAYNIGMVDGVRYRDQYDDMLRGVGVVDAKGGGLRTVTLADYAWRVDQAISEGYAESNFKDKIAIIYAEGVILDGDGAGESGEIISGSLSRKLREARLDKEIRGVVVRVNSPGGSALAADVIWREMELLREAKPLVISMGSYAASGGYYISAPADLILASRYSITGSIGVYGVMFAVEDAVRKHLKISSDGVVSSPSADLGRVSRELSPIERRAVMRGVDQVYDTFCSKVAEGRDLSESVVAVLSGGRVWSGEEASQCGLVDDIGGLSQAIKLAISRCGVNPDRVEIVEIGEEEPFAMGSLVGGVVRQSLFGAESLGELQSLLQRGEGVMMDSPLRVEF